MSSVPIAFDAKNEFYSRNIFQQSFVEHTKRRASIQKFANLELLDVQKARNFLFHGGFPQDVSGRWNKLNLGRVSSQLSKLTRTA